VSVCWRANVEFKRFEVRDWSSCVKGSVSTSIELFVALSETKSPLLEEDCRGPGEDITWVVVGGVEIGVETSLFLSAPPVLVNDDDVNGVDGLDTCVKGVPLRITE
jgi:hypothetical protein